MSAFKNINALHHGSSMKEEGEGEAEADEDCGEKGVGWRWRWIKIAQHDSKMHIMHN